LFGTAHRVNTKKCN